MRIFLEVLFVLVLGLMLVYLILGHIVFTVYVLSTLTLCVSIANYVRSRRATLARLAQFRDEMQGR